MNPVPAGAAPATLARDPVCGMNVNPATAKHIRQHDGKDFYFCCHSCADKFVADPKMYLEKPVPGTLVQFGVKTPPTDDGEFRSLKSEVKSYVCPMCTE